VVRRQSVDRRTTNASDAVTTRSTKGSSRQLLLGLASVLGLAVSAASAQTIVDEWANVKTPPAPELKPANLDPKTTALLMLDFVAPNCTQRPRCMAQVPAMKKLLAEARAKGMLVVFATGPTGKRADTVADLAPTDSEALASTGVDKFANTDLERILSVGSLSLWASTGRADFWPAKPYATWRGPPPPVVG
jgi:hypothetical protein